jgi:hypothetical protein
MVGPIFETGDAEICGEIVGAAVGRIPAGKESVEIGSETDVMDVDETVAHVERAELGSNLLAYLVKVKEAKNLD